MLIQDQIPQAARLLHTTKLMLLGCLLAACGASSEASAAPAATVEGGLDKPAVREVVRAHIGQVRECYNAELVENESVAGDVVVSFVIQPDGSAVGVNVPKSTMPARFDACLITAVEGWTFPASDAETRVSYPFELSPG
jgi:TonB family protein